MEKIVQIPKELRQFTDEVALLIVAAKQEGRLFRAGDGDLVLIEKFRIETPHYSDNEAIPRERGEQGNTVQTKIHREYFEHFKNILHTLASHPKPTHVYLFAPQHVADELALLLKSMLGAIEIRTIVGIFTEESPFELIQRLIL